MQGCSPCRRVQAVAAAALVLALAGCSGGGAPSQNQSSDTSIAAPAATSNIADATWVVEAEPTTLDPIYDYAYYDNTIIANMCEPLRRMNPDLSSSDWLATSKMVDPVTWTYDLKPGITFWDGSPVTPDDVIYSFKRNLDPAIGSYFASYFGRVQDVLQTGPSQVTVKLKEPDAMWNTSTIVGAGAYIVSKKFAEAAGDEFGTPSTGVMCTGPFKFGSWTSGDSITMEKNPDYWNHDADAKTGKLKFIFLPDSSAQANAMISGQAQGIYVRDMAILSQLQRSSGHTYFGPGLTYYFVAPTLKKGPMGDLKIRQALSKVIDRPAIVKSIFSGAGTPLRTLVGEDAFGADPAVRKVYTDAYNSYPDQTVDVDGAKQLVKEAGSPTQKIVLAYPTDGGAFQLKLASEIQDAARSIGLNVELKPLAPAEAASLYQDPEGLAAADVDMISLGFDVAPDPLSMYWIFAPSAEAVDNYSRFYEPHLTEILEKASRTYDDVERARLTVEAQKIVMDQLPVIPINSVNSVVHMGPGITGAPASYSQLWSAWAADLGGTS